MTIEEFLPIVIYVLVIVLLIILIVMGIKLLKVISKTDKLLTDVQDKVNSFNGIFRIIDVAGDKLSMGVTWITDCIISLINKFFKKRKEEEEDNE